MPHSFGPNRNGALPFSLLKMSGSQPRTLHAQRAEIDPDGTHNSSIDAFLDLLHQEPRYADLDAGFAGPALFYRPCVDCGLQTGCYCEHCNAKDRMPDQTWSPGQATPLCTLCDSMRGACHYCLDLYCILAPHSGRQHTAHASPAGQGTLGPSGPHRGQDAPADDDSSDSTDPSSGSSIASSQARPGESESAYEVRMRLGTPAPAPRWPLSDFQTRRQPSTLDRRERP